MGEVTSEQKERLLLTESAKIELLMVEIGRSTKWARSDRIGSESSEIKKKLSSWSRSLVSIKVLNDFLEKALCVIGVSY